MEVRWQSPFFRNSVRPGGCPFQIVGWDQFGYKSFRGPKAKLFQWLMC
jgi:hypothetical protein